MFDERRVTSEESLGQDEDHGSPIDRSVPHLAIKYKYISPALIQCRAYHQYNGGHVRDLYPQESYYSSYLLPPSASLGEDIERQDLGTVAGLSLAIIGMAFSAAFTGAVIAPVLR